MHHAKLATIKFVEGKPNVEAKLSKWRGSQTLAKIISITTQINQINLAKSSRFVWLKQPNVNHFVENFACTH